MEAAVLRLRAAANDALRPYEPIVLVAAPLFAFIVARFLDSLVASVHENGLKASILGPLMAFVKVIPGVSGYIESEKRKVIDKLQSGSKSKQDCRNELPNIGLGKGVLDELEISKSKDAAWKGKCSGTVYIGGSESEGHFALTNEAYSMFSHTNPLHLDVFPSVAKFEAEVVAMTAALVGSRESASGGQICGNMTSGGTESILLAVKTSRDYMKAKKGITKPEMIIPESAHSAYDKAAKYFNIKLWRVPVNKEFVADVKGIKRCINRNTILRHLGHNSLMSDVVDQGHLRLNQQSCVLLPLLIISHLLVQFLGCTSFCVAGQVTAKVSIAYFLTGAEASGPWVLNE